MNAAEYKSQLLALLPPGPAWRVDPGAPWDRLLDAFAEELARAEARAEALMLESFPRTAVEILEDWERAAGLQDPVDTAGFGLSQRQQRAVVRIAEVGDLSETGWIARAALLGHEITLTEFHPTICGEMECGEELVPQDCRFILQVNTPVELTHPAECGDLQCGDDLGAYSTQRLEAELNRVKMAHTALVFDYA